MVNKAFRERIDFLPYLIPMFLISMVMLALDFQEVAPLSLVGSLVPFGLCVYWKVIPFNSRNCIRRGERQSMVIVPKIRQESLVCVSEVELDPHDRKKDEVSLAAKQITTETTTETREISLQRSSQLDTSPDNLAFGTKILRSGD